MNAALLDPSCPVEPFSLDLPWAAWQRLKLRLGRERRNDEAWDAALQYGVPLPTLTTLLDRWRDALDWAEVNAALGELPWFRRRAAGSTLCFLHERCSSASAPTLLLLHGSFGSPLEFRALWTELIRSFHVVCPALPGFGVSSSDFAPSLRSVAEQLSGLMAALGYERYAVHGSELGGQIAAQLARSAPEQVTRLHVVELRALPEPDADDLATLSPADKSRLAALTLLEHTAVHAAPRSCTELLACALARLDAVDDALPAFSDELLLGLSLRWLGGDAAFATALADAARAPRWSRSETPTCVCSFPLAGPSLRGVAERHQRIEAWLEHDRGGAMPALEQPRLLLRSLLEFCPAP